jgi:hypothetical protein
LSFVPLSERGDFPLPVDPAQLDLPAGSEAEEQDHGRIFVRQLLNALAGASR